MAFTTVAAVVAGNKITAAWGNTVSTFRDEVATEVDLVNTTWSSPFNSGVTIGNGTVTASYSQVGRLVHAICRFVMGSTSAITGAVGLTLPVTAATTNAGWGGGVFIDQTGPTRYIAYVDWSSTTGVILRAGNSSATYDTYASLSSTVPFTWTPADTDTINVSLFYLAA